MVQRPPLRLKGAHRKGTVANAGTTRVRITSRTLRPVSEPSTPGSTDFSCCLGPVGHALLCSFLFLDSQDQLLRVRRIPVHELVTLWFKDSAEVSSRSICSAIQSESCFCGREEVNLHNIQHTVPSRTQISPHVVHSCVQHNPVPSDPFWRC